MLESDKSLDLSNIQTPVSLLWGMNDPITPIAQGRKMAKLLPHTQLHEYAGWAHAPYITHPNELASAIIEATEEATL